MVIMKSIERFRQEYIPHTRRPGLRTSARRWGAAVIAAVSAAALTVGFPGGAFAQGSIRDAEIEATIRDFATPLFRAAGLNPDSVDIYIRKDDQINAFVAGGQNLFLNTGFLLETRSPLEVIGVIAHETGHISGGHLARTSDVIRNASNAAIIATVLGVVAAAASGNAGAGAALALGGSNVAERSFLSYSRNQESAADQAALKYLDATGQSSVGLADFLGTLEDQELLSASSRSPYLSTHPLTRERINSVRNHLTESRYSKQPATADQKERYDRMIAKLFAFIRPPGRTFQKYPETDTSLPARYARAIAYFEIPDFNRALAEADGLIADRPADPFFHELRGQILFENGRPVEAEPSYRKAHELLPNNDQLTFQYARVLLSLNNPQADQEALRLLDTAMAGESQWPEFWRQRAIANGRTGRLAEAALDLAEQAVRTRRWKDAVEQARRAQSQVPAGSAIALRALDIEDQAKREIDRKK